MCEYFDAVERVVDRNVNELYDHVVRVDSNRKVQMEILIMRRDLSMEERERYKVEANNMHPYPEKFYPPVFSSVPTTMVMIQESICGCKLLKDHRQYNIAHVGMCDYHFQQVTADKATQNKYTDRIPNFKYYFNHGKIILDTIHDPTFSETNLSSILKGNNNYRINIGV